MSESWEMLADRALREDAPELREKLVNQQVTDPETGEKMSGWKRYLQLKAEQARAAYRAGLKAGGDPWTVREMVREQIINPKG